MYKQIYCSYSLYLSDNLKSRKFCQLALKRNDVKRDVLVKKKCTKNRVRNRTSVK